MSSYEWKNMSKQAQKANKEFGELTREEIQKAGEEEIDKVEKALKAMEPFNDVFEVRRAWMSGVCSAIVYVAVKDYLFWDSVCNGCGR